VHGTEWELEIPDMQSSERKNILLQVPPTVKTGKIQFAVRYYSVISKQVLPFSRTLDIEVDVTTEEYEKRAVVEQRNRINTFHILGKVLSKCVLNEWEEAQALLAKQLQKVGASISRDEPLSQTLKKRMEHYCHIFQKRSRTASPQFLFREEAELTALSQSLENERSSSSVIEQFQTVEKRMQTEIWMEELGPVLTMSRKLLVNLQYVLPIPSVEQSNRNQVEWSNPIPNEKDGQQESDIVATAPSNSESHSLFRTALSPRAIGASIRNWRKERDKGKKVKSKMSAAAQEPEADPELNMGPYSNQEDQMSTAILVVDSLIQQVQPLPITPLATPHSSLRHPVALSEFSGLMTEELEDFSSTSAKASSEDQGTRCWTDLEDEAVRATDTTDTSNQSSIISFSETEQPSPPNIYSFSRSISSSPTVHDSETLVLEEASYMRRVNTESSLSSKTDQVVRNQQGLLQLQALKQFAADPNFSPRMFSTGGPPKGPPRGDRRQLHKSMPSPPSLESLSTTPLRLSTSIFKEPPKADKMPMSQQATPRQLAVRVSKPEKEENATTPLTPRRREMALITLPSPTTFSELLSKIEKKFPARGSVVAIEVCLNSSEPLNIPIETDDDVEELINGNVLSVQFQAK